MLKHGTHTHTHSWPAHHLFALLLLLAGLLRSPFPLALGIYLRRERVLELEGYMVDDVDPCGQQDTSRLSEEQSGSEEAHRRAPVHGRAADIEGEARHHLVKQEAKVVTQESACYPQLVSR